MHRAEPTAPITNKAIPDSSANLRIGSSVANFNGSLDEAALYNKMLTPTQVQSHYAAARNAPPPTPQAPAAATGQATSVTQTAATLNGTVNPNGQDTTYSFQYGTSSGYGQST